MALPATNPAMRRIAFVCPSSMALQQMRDTSLHEALLRGHRVSVVAAGLGDGDVQALAELGVEHIGVAREAASLKLLADWKAIGTLKEALRDWAPDTVVACGGQAMVRGALAAKAAGVARVVLVVDGLPEHRFAGPLAVDEMPAWRYRQALDAASEVVFSNRDDLALLTKLGVLPAGVPVSVIRGTGVDLEGSAPLPLPPIEHGLVFLMVGGLDRRHGVMEYCAAAARLRARSPSRFLLATLPDDGAQPIDRSALEASSDVELVGGAKQQRELLGEAHVFVYPGYAEGMPKPLLDALAAGRPIVTTDVAGCRETVEEGVNGCLVAARDPDALADAMEGLLRRPDRIAAMARASRMMAERLETTAGVRAAWVNLLRIG